MPPERTGNTLLVPRLVFVGSIVAVAVGIGAAFHWAVGLACGGWMIWWDLHQVPRTPQQRERSP